MWSKVSGKFAILYGYKIANFPGRWEPCANLWSCYAERRKDAKQAHFLWVQAGKPTEGALFEKRKNTRQAARAQNRRDSVSANFQLMNDIMEAAHTGSIVLARDPPSRHFGLVFGHFGGFWQGGQLSKSLENGSNGRATLQSPLKLAQILHIMPSKSTTIVKLTIKFTFGTFEKAMQLTWEVWKTSH